MGSCELTLLLEMRPLRTTGEAWKGGLQGRTSPYPLSRSVPPPTLESMFSDFVPKIKTQPVGWHIPIFYEYPQHILVKNVLRTDYLRKTVLTMNENDLIGGGGTQMARGGIRLIHGLTKSTLITYFSGMKIYPKCQFLHAFFLICLSCSFKNLSI